MNFLQTHTTGQHIYRIDFAVILEAGNLTRYRITRPIVEEDPSVFARWFPIRTWVPDDPFRWLPVDTRIRVRHFLDSWRLYLRTRSDALVIHAFETYPLYALYHRLMHRRDLIVNNPDGDLPSHHTGWKARLWDNAIQETQLFLPWSSWAAQRIIQAFNLPLQRVCPLHPGIDLRRWIFRGIQPWHERPQLLFVAANPLLKGGDTLLEAFQGQLASSCDLTIACRSAHLTPAFRQQLAAIPNVRLICDLPPDSDALRNLYRQADVFISPTKSDTSSWVALEAMATGVPVIIAPQGGIPEIVRDRETGLLIPPRSPGAIVTALSLLRDEPALRNRIIQQARRHVEICFDACINTRRLLDYVKAAIDERNARGALYASKK